MKPLKTPTNTSRTRALDVGAGVGRVTADVLLHLVSDVLLLEPVTPFIQEALSRAKTSISNPTISMKDKWKGLEDQSKSVTFVQGPLQAFDPSHPLSSSTSNLLNRVGFQPSGGPTEDVDSGFDVIWCQWCLGHLSDIDLVEFFRRSHAALKNVGRSLIFVKENLCSDGKDGTPRSSFDDTDSSLTRCVLNPYIQFPFILSVDPQIRFGLEKCLSTGGVETCEGANPGRPSGRLVQS